MPPKPHLCAFGARFGRLLAAALLLSGAALGTSARAGPEKLTVLAVIGSSADGARLASAAAGARVACGSLGDRPAFAGGPKVVTLDDGGTEAGFKAALGRLRGLKPAGVLALPSGDLHVRYWKAARTLRVPWISLTGLPPDGARNPGNLLHLGPTAVAQAVRAADAMVAPLAARRAGIVHEPTELGRTLAAAFARNLSERVVLAGVRSWSEESAAPALGALKAWEADWIYVAMGGGHARRFAQTLAESGWRPRLLFTDGARDETLLEGRAAALSRAVFLDGPDPELEGRLGEGLVEALERAEEPIDVAAIRGFEGARLLLEALGRAEGGRLRQVWKALESARGEQGALGRLTFEHHGSARLFPFTLWRVAKGRFTLWPRGLLPTAGCGPPLAFGRPPPGRLNARGKLGFLTYGDSERRTIEADLLAIGLSTDGKQPELDEFLREEILARAIRIAHRLFRREPDGTPIPGWSWGMSFTTKPPHEEVKRSRIWTAIVAGDHPAAGGQVIGSGLVAVYSTFLKRTMYEARKLDPPVSEADRPLLDGTYRWGEDRAFNLRADEIRCLLDGFSSAVGLTLAHEFGHLCGCGHDVEHPTSIMNVVAGAGAAWADAVWIPTHQRNVTTALGIEDLER